MLTIHRKWLAGVTALCTLSLTAIGPVFGQAAGAPGGAAGGAGAPSGGTSGTSGTSGGGMTTGPGGSPTATPGKAGPTATPGTTGPSGTITTPGTSRTSEPSGAIGRASDRGDMSRSGRMSSDQVRSLQEALKQAGQDPGEIDGRMGPRTKKALVAYQREQNLPSEREAWEKLGVDMAGSQGKAQRQ